MLNNIALSIAQLPDRRFVRVFLAATSLALVLLAGLSWLIAWGVGGISTTGWPAWLADTWEWIDAGLAVLGVLAAFYFLFPAVATGIMALFLDSVVDAVEAQHYPHRAATRHPNLIENARLGLRSALRLAGYNLLALPLYLLLLFTGIGPFLLFLAINGTLLGRDLIEMVAIRHLTKEEQEAFRAAHPWLTTKLGLVSSLAFAIPILNLLAPLLGAAIATHAFHRAMGHRPAPASANA